MKTTKQQCAINMMAHTTVAFPTPAALPAPTLSSGGVFLSSSYWWLVVNEGL